MLRRGFVAVARLAERGLERIGRRSVPPVLEPYVGYETRTGWRLRARVLTSLRRSDPVPDQSRWTNLRQMVSLFVTDEVAGARVEAAGAAVLSDAEGYVDVTVPAGSGDGAWAAVPARLEDGGSVADLPVRRIGAARHIVISDIDDTMIRTGAHSLWRNLWTTFTGSALTRQVHADAVALMVDLSEAERNPVFYVSSSPWNLHDFLQRIFAAAGLPRGPMFLRDLGVSDGGGIGDGHKDHKGGAIDRILADVPDLPVFLLGDTGQEDARIYRTVIARHPGRVRGVALREPAPGVGRDDAADIAGIEAAGVRCHHGPDFGGAQAHWGRPKG